MKRIITNIVTVTAILLIPCQMTSFFGLFPAYKIGCEHPWSDTQNFIVDDKGNIIVGDAFYQLVQVYDPSGKFVTSWKPDTHGGAFELLLGDNGAVVVHAARGAEKQHVYTLQGQIIKNGAIRIAGNDTVNRKEYKITGGLFSPKIVRQIAGQEEKIIIEQPFLMNVTKPPFPFYGLGLILWVLLGLQGTIAKIKEQRSGTSDLGEYPEINEA